MNYIILIIVALNFILFNINLALAGEDITNLTEGKGLKTNKYFIPQDYSHQIQATRSSSHESLIVGSGAGMLEAFITHPLWVWKTRAQYGDSFSLNPKIIYKGVLTRIVTMSSIVGSRVLVRDNTLRYIYETSIPNFTQNFVSSFLGGVGGSFITSVSEFLLVQQQRNHNNPGFSTFYTSIQEINKNQKPSVFLRGFPCASIRDGIITSCILCVTPYLKSKLLENSIDIVSASLGAGLFSGVLSAIASHPFDTIKAIQQAESLNVLGKNTFQTSLHIYRNYGVKGFYRGFFWRTSRLTLAVPIIFYSTEFFTNFTRKFIFN